MYACRSIATVTAAFVLASLAPATAAPSVASGTFAGCPAQGSGGDPQLNELKNRSTSPPSANPITVTGMKQLPKPPPGTPAMRANWPAYTRAAIEPHEAEAVVLTGYIVRVTHETGDPSNCGSTLPHLQDVELFLADRSGVTDGNHIILAEVTPRWRAVHPAWGTASMRSVAAAGSRVRITGWLIYDEESWSDTHGRTATPWEIEPITAIAVWQNGNWTNY
jgi:hypothetical protein